MGLFDFLKNTPITILDLEKELRCSFKLVDLDEIGEWKIDKTSEYSIDEAENITGIAICRFDLKEIPKALSKNIRNLGYLLSLSLLNNKISDISTLKGFINIQTLRLDNNQISDISVFIKFKSIKILNLQNNQINNINSLRELVTLQKLGLGNNRIYDISALKELKNIQWLFLNNNQINNIITLKEFKNLKQLNLPNNPIETLPEWITDFPKMNIQWDSLGEKGYVSFYNNPINNIPIEVVKQGKEAIRNYFKQLLREKEQKYLFETKLLIIGEGGAGKTTFASKIKDIYAKMPEDINTTLGVDVSSWEFLIHHPSFGEKVMFTNIWDFGGQNLYKGTHQMFFTTKSLYVLVVDTREDKTNSAYWINTVEQLAKNGSKLLVVTNKKHSHVTQIDKNGLLGHFGDLIVGFIEIDLKNDIEGIEKLQASVKHYLQNLPEIGSQLPASWVNIRKDLFHLGKNFITYDHFIEICKKNSTDLENLHFLSEYYNRVGVFTHYYDDSLLCERVYLNSNWLMHTVYRVLNHPLVKDKNGRLSEIDVKSIWNGNELFNETAKLSRLMNRFGLMYEIVDRKEYVVPAHLQANQPYSKWIYDDSNEVLHFVYEFDKYMPKGIMSRLIVALHRFIKNHELVWQKGVNIGYNSTAAEITETYDKNNKYVIRLVGNEKKELLGIINSKFDDILSPFRNLQYEKLVPCICSECKNASTPYFYKYSDLMRRKEKGRILTECEKSYEEVDVRKLIDDVILNKGETLKTSRNKVFISYSHKDEEYLIKVQKNLKVLEMEGLKFNLWDDTQIKAGMNWFNEIKENLKATKVAILLISTDFLISDFITRQEVPALLKASEEEGAIIIPLIIKPCRFTKNSTLNQFQSIHNPSQPLSDFSENEQQKILLKLVERIEELILN